MWPRRAALVLACAAPYVVAFSHSRRRTPRVARAALAGPPDDYESLPEREAAREKSDAARRGMADDAAEALKGCFSAPGARRTFAGRPLKHALPGSEAAWTA